MNKRLAMLTMLPAAIALTCAPAAAAPAERRYHVLRFEEDWSFLGSEPQATPDPFDRVKNVRLSEAWTFLLGGSVRLRLEADDGRSLGGPVRSDEVARARGFLHWELRHRADFRWFVETGASMSFATDRRVPPLMEDDPDFQNFFVEGTFGSLGSTPVSIRVGRQELLFGAQRLVSPLDWSNSRRSWDGIALIARTKRTRTTAFATRPAINEKHEIDSPSDDVSFSGAHVQFKPRAGQVVEGYAWLHHDSSGRHVSAVTGRPGDVDRQTFGMRWEWTRGGWSGDVEAAIQRGDASDDDISAEMISVQAGHQWAKAPWKPRVGLGLDHASGDGDPSDGDIGTFEAPYPLGHAWIGHADIVGRKNIEAARVSFEAWPASGWKLEATLHRFWLAEERDALYEPGNAVLRKDASGDSGRDVGVEFDVLATWSFRTHHSVGIELSRFWTGDFLERTGSADDFWWGWIGWEFRF